MKVIERCFLIAIVVAMVVAFATVHSNLTCSIDCFMAAVFLFIGALPLMEKGVPYERED